MLEYRNKHDCNRSDDDDNNNDNMMNNFYNSTTDKYNDNDNDNAYSASGMGNMQITAANGVWSLQRLCEICVAVQLVEPRSVLQVLEYADAAGADSLKHHCLGVRFWSTTSFLGLLWIVIWLTETQVWNSQ